MTVVSYKNVKRPIIPPGDLPMLALFARGEQGAWYDPSDLYNYAIERGPELADMATAALIGAAERTAEGIRLSGIGASTGVIEFSNIRSSGNGRTFEVIIEFTTATGSPNERPVVRWGSTFTPASSPYSAITTGSSGALRVTTHAALTTDATITRVSVRELSGVSRATMFQDAEGTIPVTGVEQPVGLILDKSGNRNHASQLTAPARPLLSARVNRLANSNDFTAGYWTKAVALTPNQPGPFGKNDATLLTVETAGSYRRLYRPNVTAEGELVVHTIYAKAGTARYINHHSGSGAGVAFDLVDGVATVAPAISSTTQAVITPIGDGWWRCEVRHLAGYTSVYWMVTSAGGTTGAEGDSIFVALAQVEFGRVATKYQHVNSATDYDWLGWPLYLAGDGVDDALNSGSNGALSVSASSGFTLACGYEYAYMAGVTGAANLLSLTASGSATVYCRLGQRADHHEGRISSAVMRNSALLTPAIPTASVVRNIRPNTFEVGMALSRGHTIRHRLRDGAEAQSQFTGEASIATNRIDLFSIGQGVRRIYGALVVLRELSDAEAHRATEAIAEKSRMRALP